MAFSNLSDMADVSWSQNNNTQLSNNRTCVLNMVETFVITSYVVVFIVGFIGNSIVVLTFAPSWKKGPIIELLIIYLAFFDLLASIFGPWLFVYWIATCHKKWDFGWLGCKVLPTLCRVFTDISIGVILTMAIDRCRSIVTPLRNRFSRKSIHISVGITIVLSCIWELYYVFGLFINENGLCTVMTVSDPRFSYPLIVLTAWRNIAFVVIFSLTTLAVYIKLKSSADQVLLQNSQGYNQIHSQRSRVMKMLVTMAIVFAITVIPRDIFHLTFTISWMDSDGLPYTSTTHDINSILKLLQVSNSIYNVFIYGKMHDHFLHNLRVVICRVKGGRHLTYRTTIRRNKRLNSSTSSAAIRRPSFTTELDKRERMPSTAFLGQNQGVIEEQFDTERIAIL
ncbi:prolactin-releasing peptide receptor-like [Hydractinia symbiolongicarpus]|uniref:prolactin-releasing peptide receptor-like n=1 Tax=Hydractinia symbiolongicarpus TaxID=13093 RepID=UPI00255158DB|nr:prolactin-releasing peptide receptor-like [Hydractinia symbiolongicarpus]